MRPRPVIWISTVVLVMLASAQAADLEAVQLSSAIVRTVTLEKSRPATPIWRTDELDRITQADGFLVAPYRDNHVTLADPSWTWSVAVDGELYVRAYNGTRSSWYKSAIRERAGQISTGGLKKLVAFEPVQGAINDDIDAAYQAKYAGSRYLEAMLSERASASTLRIRPAE
jgi:hypothetical protein